VEEEEVLVVVGVAEVLVDVDVGVVDVDVGVVLVEVGVVTASLVVVSLPLPESRPVSEPLPPNGSKACRGTCFTDRRIM
jgi:hypothetical protein